MRYSVLVAGPGSVDLQGRRLLPPVTTPRTGLVVGWILEAVGVGGPADYVVTRGRHENIGDHLSAATIRLAWHRAAHTAVGASLLIAAGVVFTVGSVVTARPFVRRPLTLLVAVPAAVLPRMLVLGVAGPVIAAVVTRAENFDLSGLGDVADFADSGHRNYRRSRRFARWVKTRSKQ